MKIGGKSCNIRTIPRNTVFPFDIAIGIQEIQQGNDFTTSDDEEEKYKVLIDYGPLTESEKDGLHDDIKSQCQGITPRKYKEQEITKDQNDNLRSR